MTTTSGDLHTFESAGGVHPTYRRWLPDGDVRATIQLVHGASEHSGRYERLAAALTGAGLAVYAMDLRGHGRTVYVLDEPTTGLHFEDIRKLLRVLESLVDKGNTVIVIEHNLDVVKSADWIIDMGPEGGSGGGLVVAEGTPEQVAEVEGSYTGEFLRHVLTAE